jgi:radical SAM superfamily enzyme YgiQ (UPF0313 family)
MPRALLLQLPLPQLNFGRRTGNIPLGAACLQQAAADLPDSEVQLLSPVLASYLGDSALENLILGCPADILGFSVYSWNLERSLNLCRRLKARRTFCIVLGGPEVTPDNPLPRDPAVDFLVYGDGEAVFKRLIREPAFWSHAEASLDAGPLFAAARSPYREDLLDPRLEDLVLLEAQRGCSYGCGYCYYGKTRRRPALRPIAEVTASTRWALDHGVGEIYLLDPSLDTRPDLPAMLDALAGANREGRVRFTGEIRAEAVDNDLADRLTAAGFTSFEVGLQTTNSRAMQLMGRHTDPTRFRDGVRRLQERGISTTIDLIAGLPGDNLEGFRRSLEFLVRHRLQTHVQVFPLAVLPGTRFRRDSVALGLRYQPLPPYTIEANDGFTPRDLATALEDAETFLEVSLRPPPDLDLAHRFASGGLEVPAPDLPAAPDGRPYIYKILLSRRYTMERLEAASGRLTHPYQVFILPSLKDAGFTQAALTLLTAANPHTPLEIVWLEPPELPDLDAIEAGLGLVRPHYLDRDRLAAWGGPVIFTLASHRPARRFQAPSRRWVRRWDAAHPPEPSELEPLLETADGVLLEAALPLAAWRHWQARMAPLADGLPRITFADPVPQALWMRRTAADEYRPEGSAAG